MDKIEFEMAVDPSKGGDFDEDVIDELLEVLLWFFQIYFSFKYSVFSWLRVFLVKYMSIKFIWAC